MIGSYQITGVADFAKKMEEEGEQAGWPCASARSAHCTVQLSPLIFRFDKLPFLEHFFASSAAPWRIVLLLLV